MPGSTGVVGSAPVVSITTPINGELQDPAEPTMLVVSLADDTTAVTDLTVEIESDIDGIIEHSGVIDEAGEFKADITLSGNDHVLTVRATDEDDQTGNDSVEFPVNGRPGAVEISFDPAEPGVGDAFSAIRTDAIDPEGDEIEYAWSWTMQETEADPANAVPVFTPDIMAGITERGEIWTATVVPSDLYGEGPSTSASVMVGNRAPSAEMATLSPDPATTVDDITITVSGWSDFDEDPEGYNYSWAVNGETIEGETTDTLGADNHEKGDNVIGTAVPFDGYAFGDPVASAPLTIGNTAPQAVTVSITPVAPSTVDDLAAIVAGWSDIDGDTEGYTYRWFVDGEEDFSVTSETYPASLTEHFQEIYVEATPFDGDDPGLPLTSGSVLIGNTPPALVSVELSPDSPTTSDVIVATPIGWSDLDGDEAGYSYSWSINGETVGIDTSALPPSLTNRGDEIRCTVTPFDGTYEGAPVTSDALVIGNSAPSVGTANISPTDAKAADTLTCSWSMFIDPDGSEDPDLSTVEWFVDGVSAGTDTTLSGAFIGGQTVTCRVTPYDGIDYGSSIEDSIVITNTSPEITGVSINPDPAYAANTLTCEWVGFEDDDSDADVSTVVWTINGEPTTADGPTLTGGFRDDDIIECTVTPSDGEDTGTPMATSIEISNTPPTIESATVSPTSPIFSDTLTCSWSGYFDDDDDEDLSLPRWFKGDGEYLGRGATISDVFVGGEAVYCVVTPYDGKDAGASVTSDAVTVENTAPTLASAILTPLEATVEDVMVCEPGATTDPDGTTDFSYTYRWEVSGLLFSGETSSTLAAPAFSRGQTVQCFATPNDGVEDGEEVGSNIVEVRNSIPVVNSVVISPDVVQTNDIITAEVDSFDADGEDVILTYQWRVNGVVVLESTTVSSLNGAEYFDKGDEVQLDVTPADSPSDEDAIGATVSSNTVSVVNSAPDVSVVEISPSEAKAGDTLTCSWPLFLDPDGEGDPDLSSIEWFIGGASAGSGPTFAGDFVGGQTVTCEVTPYDGFDYGEPVEGSIVIDNTAPSVSVVSITPNPAFAESTLTCNWSGFMDVDGGSDESYVTWTINGMAAAGDGVTLTGGYRDDDVVTCTVIPFDGEDTGEPVVGTIELSNTPPAVASVSVSPTSPAYDETLTCSWSGYTDADGDPDASTAQWFNGDGDLLGSGTTLTGGFYGGDAVRCVVTPNDGKDAGTPVESSPVIVENSPPTLANVNLTPDEPTVESTLVCEPGVATDPDGTTDITFTYRWTVSALPSAGAESNTLTAPAFERGDTVQCFATPSDGSAEGDEVASNVVSIQNTAPQITSVSISPEEVQTNDIISSDHETYDIDGDAVTVNYQWRVNGVVVLEGPTVSSLNGAEYFDKSDEVQLDITPIDDADAGATEASNVTLVINTAPGTPVVDVEPPTPQPEDDLFCAILVDGPDADDDDLTYTYRWFKDGVETPHVGATISAALTVHAEHWECEATSNDDEESGGFSSDSVVINDLTDPDPPQFDDMSHFSNGLLKEMTGDCEAECEIEMVCSDTDSTLSYESTCSVAGRFSQEVSLTRGDWVDCYATCTDIAGNTSGPSSTFSTEACEPYDVYEDEDGYGDDATNVIDEWSTINDDGSSVISIAGNVLDDDDDDWYVISTEDDLAADIAAGIDYFNFNVELVSGTSDYRFVIHKGGTGAGDLECADVDGYTEYNWFLEDDGGTAHSSPSDSRECRMSSASYSECEDNSDEFYIHVYRLGSSEMSCDRYELEITNGVW